MKKLKKLWRKFKKLFNLNYIAKTRYRLYLKKLPLQEKTILLDSQHGKNIKGNMFYLLKELLTNPDYQDYQVYVSTTKNAYKEIAKFLQEQNLDNCHLIKMGTFTYYKIVASAKYLFSDTSFLAFFIKREGQIYCNVWHGTPLKHLGKSDNTNFYAIGNVQKNFLVADYLLYPNDYMKNHMIADYMLENLSKAKVLMCGYPRNTVFFDKKEIKRIRQECNLEDKEVIVYMPTWRGTEDENEVIENYLTEIDKSLKPNQVIYVNLHPFIGDQISYENFKHIHKFPAQYETYQFLSTADCLITDYSSIFVDFAGMNKKILLFTYDEEEYYQTRGCYMTVDELPFTKVKNVSDLIKALNKKEKIDYHNFINEFCKYDSIDATKKLCDHVILNKKCLKEEDIPDNGKENVLIYTGSLAKNGITSALMNLLHNIDVNEKNYYLTYVQSIVRPHKATLAQIPEGVKFISTVKGTTSTIFEKIISLLYFKGILKSNWVQNKINNIYKLDIKRSYGDIRIDYAIQFGGYDSRQIILFSQFDCERVIFVHSDMQREVSVRKTQKKNILKYAYNNYDQVAAVSEAMVKPTASFMKDTSRLVVVDNMISNKTIALKGEEDISFDDNTECNIEFEELIKILNNKKVKKFINVGRFSVEKCHRKLINAFNRIWENNHDVYLVLIGGHGNLYQKTIEYIDSLPCANNVIVIKALSNPFPVVKKCDCFVLSSLYEAFGLCLAEADILGLTTFSVDIEGPKKFIQKYHGHIVSNDEEGIYQGMQDYLQGKIEKMQVNYDEYNQKALEEFYSLFKK